MDVIAVILFLLIVGATIGWLANEEYRRYKEKRGGK